MALVCGLVQSTIAFQAGQSPPPTVALVASNPNATPVTITGVELWFTDVNGNVMRSFGGNLPLVPLGPGQPTTIAAGASTTLGGMSISPPNLANGSQFSAVPPSTNPSNPQGAQPMQVQFFMRARVYASDGSVNLATPAEFFMSYTTPPPKAFQGGAVVFSDINDAALLAAVL